jgi:putative glutamine amidotransferase
MKKIPVIGVTHFDINTENKGYLLYLKLVGAVPLMIPHVYGSEEEAESILSRLDGLLLTGGDDINPFLYNEDVVKNKDGAEVCGELDESRDISETVLLNVALRLNIPVFGICRGLQLINIVYGGSLYQDLPTQFERDDSVSSSPTRIIHRQKKHSSIVTHRVNIIEKTPLFNLFKTNSIGVNSLHHQGIKVLGNNLTVMARATGYYYYYIIIFIVCHCYCC